MRVQTKQINYLLLIPFAGFIMIGIAGSLMGIAWPSVRDTFGLSLSALGSLLLATTIGFLLVSISMGRLVAKIGIGWFLFSGFLLSGFGYLGYAITPSWWILVFCGLVTGWGVGSIDAGLNYYAAEHHSVRTMNWLHASFGIGAAFGPILMTAIFQAGLSWRFGFAINGLLNFLMCLAVGLTMTQWRLVRTAAQETGQSQASVGATLKRIIVWLSILIFFVLTGLEGSTAQWTYTLFTEGRSVNLAMAGLWVSFFWGGMTVGRVVLGAVVERVGSVRLIRLCLLGAILATVGIMAQIDSLNAFSMAFLGFCIGPTFPTLMSGTPQRVGVGYVGHTVGFQMAATSIGFSMLPALLGVLAEDMGLEVVGGFLVITAVLTLILYEIIQLWLRRSA